MPIRMFVYTVQLCLTFTHTHTHSWFESSLNKKCRNEKNNISHTAVVLYRIAKVQLSNICKYIRTQPAVKRLSHCIIFSKCINKLINLQ